MNEPAGQFQQSSSWAIYKAAQGWSCQRHVFYDVDKPVAGFQILWKTRFKLARAYISKGPVLSSNVRHMENAIINRLKDSITSLGCLAVIVQGPDQTNTCPLPFSSHGFLPNHLTPVIDATLQNDLCLGLEEIYRRMNRSVRAEIRKAKASGIIIRHSSDEKDIRHFFELMCQSSLRQGQKPNPGSAKELQILMEGFPPEQVRLTLASYKGQVLAGLFTILFGRHATAWKKGWNGHYPELYVNRLLNAEGMDWAYHHGYSTWDYSALDRRIAIQIMRGGPLSEHQKKSRHMFNLGFGGTPLLLPNAWVWFPNKLLRKTYQFVSYGIATQR